MKKVNTNARALMLRALKTGAESMMPTFPYPIHVAILYPMSMAYRQNKPKKPKRIFFFFFLSLVCFKIFTELVDRRSVRNSTNELFFIIRLQECLLKGMALSQFFHGSGCDDLSVFDDGNLIAEFFRNIQHMG